MLSILYRAYPFISKRPVIQFPNKDELLKFSLSSLCVSLKGIEYEFVFLSDNCTSSQKAIVEGMLRGSATSFRIIELGGLGNQRSFAAQLGQVSACRYENVLLLEDDYYIGPYDIGLNIKALSESLGDYTTFYYPPDAESTVGGMSRGSRNSRFLKGFQGTVLPSTTLTFFSKKETLLADIRYFQKFASGAHDSSLWLRLTGSFLWFLTRLKYRQFYMLPKLYLSVIKRYIRHMCGLPVGSRRLVFVGTGLSTHLDSIGVFNRFSQEFFLEDLYKHSCEERT